MMSCDFLFPASQVEQRRMLSELASKRQLHIRDHAIGAYLTCIQLELSECSGPMQRENGRVKRCESSWMLWRMPSHQLVVVPREAWEVTRSM